MQNMDLAWIPNGFDGSSKCSGTNATNPCTLSQPSPSIALGSQVGSTNDEYVGFDDENMYGSYGDDGFVHENAMYAIQEVQIDSETNLEDNVAEEPIVEDGVDGQANVAFNSENPNIEVNALFPNVNAFRRALRHFAIKNEFEVSTVKLDKKRFIGKCKHPDCPWRIRASRLQDNKTFMIKKLPHDHTCPSTSMVDGKMASSSWVSERVGDWLRKNPSAGAKEVKSKLEDEFHVKVTYNKAWEGRRAALNQIHGKWDESFQLVYNFKAELERRCPGSIVEIDFVVYLSHCLDSGHINAQKMY